MINKFWTVLSVCLLLIVFPALASSEPLEIPAHAKCAECGMMVHADSMFTAQMVGSDGKLMAFCDIGDMLIYFKGMKETPKESYVKDFNSNTWTDAKAAKYVKDAKKFKTPMMWSIAAFKDMHEAHKSGNPVAFEEALGLVQ